MLRTGEATEESTEGCNERPRLHPLYIIATASGPGATAYMRLRSAGASRSCGSWACSVQLRPREAGEPSSQGKPGGDPRSPGSRLHGGIQRKGRSPAVRANSHGQSEGVLKAWMFTRAWGVLGLLGSCMPRPESGSRSERWGGAGLWPGGSGCQDARMDTPPGWSASWYKLIASLHGVWSQPVQLPWCRLAAKSGSKCTSKQSVEPNPNTDRRSRRVTGRCRPSPPSFLGREGWSGPRRLRSPAALFCPAQRARGPQSMRLEVMSVPSLWPKTGAKPSGTRRDERKTSR